jgi:hypothetical protein
MKRVIVVLVGVLLFCGIMTGCEERKTEGEKVEKEEKEGGREIDAKLGQPLTFWTTVVGTSVKHTQLSIVFQEISVNEKPHLSTMEERGKNYVKIVAKLANLGPREESMRNVFFWMPKPWEIKVDKGYIYRVKGPFTLVKDNRFPEPKNEYEAEAYCDFIDLEPGYEISLVFESAIPKDTTPVEMFVSPRSGGAKFRLKLH